MNKQTIISDRWDGFGERMLSFLNAMYIADKFDYNFGFLWYELKEKNNFNNNDKILSPKVPSADKIFDSSFLKRHLYNQLIGPSYDDNYWWSLQGNSLKEILSMKKEENILFSFQGDLSNFFIDIQKEEYYDKIKILFNSIPFLSSIKESILDSLNISKKLNEFVAIHIRNGDIIYDPELTYQFKLKAFPYHLASYFIEHIKNNKKVVIFGNDLKSNFILKKNLNKIKQSIFIIDELILKKYNYIQRIFFEIILMSQSDTLYTTGASGFSNLASRINNFKVISLHANYTEEWLYEQLKYGISNYKFDNMQTSFSYIMLYYYAEKLQKTNIIKINILQKGLKLNTSHFYIFSILYIDLLLNNKRFYFIDMFLFNLNIDFFCDVLLSNVCGSFFYFHFWKNYFYDDISHTKSISILYLKLKISNFVVKNNLNMYFDQGVLSFYLKQNDFFKNYNIDKFSFINFLQLFKNYNIDKKYIFCYQNGFYLVNDQANITEVFLNNFEVFPFDYIDINLGNLLKNSIYYQISYQVKVTKRKYNIIKYFIILYKLFRIRKKIKNRKYK